MGDRGAFKADRHSARKLLCWLGVAAATSASGCLIPPDLYPPANSTSYPPELVTDQIRPSLLTAIDASVQGCVAFDVEVGALDRDSVRLRYRWIANNALAGKTTLLLSDEEQTIVPGTPRQLQTKIVPSQDFPFEHGIANGPLHPPQTGFLSLFITDGDWAIEDPINDDGAHDFGQIASDDSGASGRVVQIGWAFVFEAGIGGCGE